MTIELSLFPDVDECIDTINQGPITTEKRIITDEENRTDSINDAIFQQMTRTGKTRKSVIGKNFIVKKCKRCSQLMLIDPAHPEERICNACNEKYISKWTQLLKLKL